MRVQLSNELLFLRDHLDGVFLRDGSDPLLQFRLRGGKLLVSVQIRDEKGDLIAELRDNEWLHQSRPAIFDRNYTEHALEIRDASGAISLQVVDFGQTIYVAGIFRCKNGLSWAIGPETGCWLKFSQHPKLLREAL